MSLLSPSLAILLASAWYLPNGAKMQPKKVTDQHFGYPCKVNYGSISYLSHTGTESWLGWFLVFRTSASLQALPSLPWPVPIPDPPQTLRGRGINMGLISIIEWTGMDCVADQSDELWHHDQSGQIRDPRSFCAQWKPSGWEGFLCSAKVTWGNIRCLRRRTISMGSWPLAALWSMLSDLPMFDHERQVLIIP